MEISEKNKNLKEKLTRGIIAKITTGINTSIETSGNAL